ncbi:uncharacterized protein LOC142175094 [Nicotiana tabacum]|uniref:Uncharacterized protein LOC142175094 n=1 Tax=Nicotiana tabacum TaxID=4097 RepID=A0AC58TKF3_TOBAC
MNFTNYEPKHSFGMLDHGGPSGSHHLNKNVHHGISSHYDFENEQVEPHVLTQLPEDDVLNRDLADAQSEEENSDYDNNADESGDDTPFPCEDGDEEDEKEGPDSTREYAPPPRRSVYESQVPFHSREIPYLDNYPSMPEVEALTRDFDEIRIAMWDESRPTVLAKGMLFHDKARVNRSCKMHNVKECREMAVCESSPVVYKVVDFVHVIGCCVRARRRQVCGKWVNTFPPTHAKWTHSTGITSTWILT